MNKTIFKYPLETTSTQALSIPKDAEILTIQIQNNVPMLWALVNPSGDKELRLIETFGTGRPVGVDMGVERKYIATYQQLGGQLVWHVFERID